MNDYCYGTFHAISYLICALSTVASPAVAFSVVGSSAGASASSSLSAKVGAMNDGNMDVVFLETRKCLAISQTHWKVQQYLEALLCRPGLLLGSSSPTWTGVSQELVFPAMWTKLIRLITTGLNCCIRTSGAGAFVALCRGVKILNGMDWQQLDKLQLL
uniref:Secreted protein n=1 Tax=Ditylenchus dipsaci TaxID=166011 RepID=A0A915CXQ7_9BILA